MLKNFFPNKVLTLNKSFIESLLIGMILLVSVGLIYALFISPPDHVQGESVRIMYIHVPSAWLSMLTFFIMEFYLFGNAAIYKFYCNLRVETRSINADMSCHSRGEQELSVSLALSESCLCLTSN